MPIMDGCEALKQIREYEVHNHKENIPIITLTANAIKGDKEKILALGKNDYLTKPINTKALNNVFTKYLNKSKDEIKAKIDISKVAKNLGIGENIASRIVDKFLKDIEKDLEELKNLIDNKNINEINQKAHYIKNSCLNVSNNEECEILGNLEKENLAIQDAKKLYEELIKII